MKTLVNAALFQVGWFGCILGAAAGYAWMGPALVVGSLAAHGVFVERRDLELVLPCALIGTAVDSGLSMTGTIEYASQPLAWLAPPWIIAMWANMALVLRHSLAWLARHRTWTTLAGAVSGPLAYWSGWKLGAITAPLSPAALVALSVVWALALPLLYRLAGPQDPMKSSAG